jgi:hypothetical protein
VPYKHKYSTLYVMHVIGLSSDSSQVVAALVSNAAVSSWGDGTKNGRDTGLTFDPISHLTSKCHEKACPEGVLRATSLILQGRLGWRTPLPLVQQFPGSILGSETGRTDRSSFMDFLSRFRTRGSVVG